MASARPISLGAHQINAMQLASMGGNLRYGCITVHEQERYIDDRGRWEVHYKQDENAEQTEGKTEYVALIGHVNEVKEIERVVMTANDWEKGRTVFELLKTIWTVMATATFLTNVETGRIRATEEEEREVRFQWREAMKRVEQKGGNWWFKDSLQEAQEGG